jgi:NAD(P)-dependent dehydrogenase (short-subunit alcohol dehydrogenase family)
MPDYQLQDKVVIVTGASRGIGESTARFFAECGARVVLAARTEADLARVVADIAEAGGTATAVRTDVADAAEVDHLLEETLRIYGRLDAAFNNAGGGHMPKPLAELSEDDFDASVRGNMRSTFLCMRREIQAMSNNGGGAIVNMSSSAGIQAAPRMGAYCAAKHGVIGLTRAAALDYGGENIRVNVLAPGPIQTHRLQQIPEETRASMVRAIPLKRLGDPGDVARTVAWLCSSAANFITGAVIPIDGGKTIANA